MKAIIIDDEKHVRDAIKLLVDWKHFGIDTVLEAQDGMDAMKRIEEEKPELIFTDMMMPLKSGMELLEWLRDYAPHSKTIVISGHDDFELVRHTVKYGGTDYILKPIDRDQLHEAVEKALASWRQEEEQRCEQRQRNIEMNQIRPVYWDKIWSGLITEPHSYESAAEALHREFGIGRGASECRLAILSLLAMSESLKSKFASSQDLLIFSLINICNEFLHGSGNGTAFRHWNDEDEIILIWWRHLDGVEEQIRSIDNGIVKTLKSRLDFGISLRQPFPKGVPAAYREAKEALLQRNLLVRDTRLHLFAPAPPVRPKMPHFSSFEESFRFAIRSGSEEQIRIAVREWIRAVREQEAITLEQLQLWWHEYTVLQTRWLQELFPEDGSTPAPFSSYDMPFNVPLDEEGRLSIGTWQQQLESALIQLSRRLLERQHKENHVIYEIAKYIQNHYHQDITLQDIAGHFYLSREYISRKFKQEFHVNISDYITSIRMDRAKLLLLNPSYRISQIAELVGYDDEKYFSKVFKKTVGISPNEYRKLQS
ncbi:response regulator [Paenibacillus hamazuiensis]|uniref:response regulator n=1 Tax=Paenibacillus hamazuiensis TaxID=2936508 RepID=UPI00200DAF73|nr:response regulator [Paenibacillus hamazuiensis]